MGNKMEIKSESWLITGGCGFIGTSLIAHLLKETPGINIRVIDNLSVGTEEDLSEVCDFVKSDPSHLPSHSAQVVQLIVGDIRSYDTCLRCCEGIDVVVHLAANTGVAPSVEKPRADMEANVIGTFNMLEAAKCSKVDKFIFASSGAPIGEVEPPITEDKPPRPVSPYGASKLAGEGYCSAYYRTFGIKTVALRFGNVYGPRSKHKGSVVARFFKQALDGQTLEVFGDGKQTRDFIFIDDLIQAIINSAEKETGGEIFQIATFKETTVNEIAESVRSIVEEETGRKVKIVYGNRRPGDVRRNYSDISKARRMLGYEPVYDLGSGLRITFRYFKLTKGGSDESLRKGNVTRNNDNSF
jgi:UDP-glucose 4-epimerase